MRQPANPAQPTLQVTVALISATIAVACFLHCFRIDRLPMGFYVDESSIGYNAHLIALTGADEHGARWPLFFEAFGEYKNPLYIYLVAGFYRLFGYSLWTTRAVSAFCWIMGTLLTYALSKRLFVKNSAHLYLALCLSFTPWLFALSRISFELVVLYPLLALHLLALYRGFEEGSSTWTLVCGIALSLCLYAYTTFRLLAPLHSCAVLACYFAPQYRRQQLRFALGAMLGAAPFMWYSFEHFNNLTHRFNSLTYLYDHTLTIPAKIELFAARYFGYLGPSFLALSGDENQRHHTGFGGELLLSTVILLVVALMSFRNYYTNRFYLYLIAGVLLSPVAAALTLDTHHSLRVFSMAVFAVVLSAYGLSALGPNMVRAAVAATAACSALYLGHYFLVYPAESAVAFYNFDFEAALDEALRRSPARVVLSDEGDQAYINLLFFGSLSKTHVPLLTGSRRDLRPGDVYIDYNSQGGASGYYTVEAGVPPGTSRNTRVTVNYP